MNQLWTFSFLTGTELASMQIGGSARGYQGFRGKATARQFQLQAPSDRIFIHRHT